MLRPRRLHLMHGRCSSHQLLSCLGAAVGNAHGQGFAADSSAASDCITDGVVPVQRAKSAEIFVEWVPDALGYHLPLRDRQEMAPAATASDSSSSSSSSASDAHVADSADADGCPTAPRTERGPPFCGPVKKFATSPVFEWQQCLWQWRPVSITAPAAKDRDHTLPIVAVSTSCEAHKSGGDLSAQEYYLVPFLLCPTAHVHTARPVIHEALYRELAAAQRTVRGQPPNDPQTRGEAKQCGATAALLRLKLHPWNISMPTPVGLLRVGMQSSTSGGAPPVPGTVPELPIFDMLRGCHSPRPSQQSGSGATAHLDTMDGGGGGGGAGDAASAVYTHVFHTAASETASAAGAPVSACLSQSKWFSCRCNAIGGGLADLVLAVDRYAALIARRELTLSAACWATLCDSKNWWTVNQLRISPLETERELVAAAEAHTRWQHSALTRNNTLVGKCSHDILFYDYPHLAKWLSN